MYTGYCMIEFIHSDSRESIPDSRIIFQREVSQEFRILHSIIEYNIMRDCTVYMIACMKL